MFAGGKQHLAGERPSQTPFLLYLGAIRSFISKRVNPNDVDDIVQDVALRMHQRVEKSGIDNVEGYLFQVARSVLADHKRRNDSRMASSHDELEDHNHPSEACLPDRIAEGREELQNMLAALEALPDRSRQAFILHRFEEMSYADIATHMGISISAVEKNIMRAIKHLAACRTRSK